ncbi:NAD(P)-dependent oxidoreductase [Congregibacter brevis]|uniref:NAD(P)-dependent oxidoreductase n=1 Tax=Congregibacter brevis TaxID=3081201 RepID=A0ABZ0IDY2_9GAMM|nr:NAD(P)-dependent oxidoreductase [Congregibacter sp. IMCC45268]
MSLKNKTIFITGASRGIGLAIAKRAAADGANVAIAAKTTEPHPKLPGTIYTAAEEIEAAGGKALPLVCDIRFEDQVQAAVDKTVETFGSIDICINNASAISPTPTLGTEMKRYDLMNEINTRGTFLTSKTCIPHLQKSDNGHILNLAPPLDMEAKWFAPHVAYTIAKMGMSLCTLGMSKELADDAIAVNSLWPLTAIDTAAVRNVLGGDAMSKGSRTVAIMADAAYEILTRPSKECTGNFFIDEVLLRDAGVTDFDQYAVVPGEDLFRDFFVPDDVVDRLPTKTLTMY